jgi:hypothetical protein
MQCTECPAYLACPDALERGIGNPIERSSGQVGRDDIRDGERVVGQITLDYLWKRQVLVGRYPANVYFGG